MDSRQNTHILVVGDAAPSSPVARGLNQVGYEVQVTRSRRDALRQVQAARPDLILLQASRADRHGGTLIPRLRRVSDRPLMVLSADGDEDTLVQALDQGADDYVVTPVSLPELRARVGAALRRAAMPPAPPHPKLAFGNGWLVVDLDAQSVTAGGQPVHLTPTEYRLLLILALHAGCALTPAQIVDAIWPGEPDRHPAGPGPERRRTNLKGYIRRLRAKIEPDPHHPTLLRTHRRTGYSLSPS